MSVAGLLHGTIRGGRHRRISNRLRRAVILCRYNHWDVGRSHDSARDTESNAAKKNKNKKKNAGTEDDGENAPAPKVSAPELANATDVETTQKKLWELQHKKNAEANTKAYDLNQKTVQALDTFEEK